MIYNLNINANDNNLVCHLCVGGGSPDRKISDTLGNSVVFLQNYFIIVSKH